MHKADDPRQGLLEQADRGGRNVRVAQQLAQMTFERRQRIVAFDRTHDVERDDIAGAFPD